MMIEMVVAEYLITLVSTKEVLAAVSRQFQLFTLKILFAKLTLPNLLGAQVDQAALEISNQHPLDLARKKEERKEMRAFKISE